MAQIFYGNTSDVSADNVVYQHSADTKHRTALIARTERPNDVKQRIPYK